MMKKSLLRGIMRNTIIIIKVNITYAKYVINMTNMANMTNTTNAINAMNMTNVTNMSKNVIMKLIRSIIIVSIATIKRLISIKKIVCVMEFVKYVLKQIIT